MRHLEAAAAGLSPTPTLDVHRSPFFLYPDLPRFKNSDAHVAEKEWPGPWPLRWGKRVDLLYGQAATQNIGDLGRSVGYNFNFDAISSNTFDSHRALLWAEAQGKGLEYGKVLARKYFEEGQVLSDHAVLAAAAAEVGIREDEALAFLASDVMTAEVVERYDSVHREGITSIPVFIFEVAGKTASVHGSASQAQFTDVLRKILA